jgi:hypothetical protein
VLQKILIDKANLAPPGIPSVLVVAPESILSFVENEPCEFEITCVLSRNFKATRKSSSDSDSYNGDSFFCPPENTSSVKIYSNNIELYFLTNDDREFASVQASLQAVSNNEAESLFMAALSRVLDHWSFLANTPISIDEIGTKNVKNGLLTINYTLPYENVIISLGKGESFSELIPIFALYREAKNSASNFYRFLCYYKILEGIYKKLRSEVFNEAKERGKEIARIKEIVPDLPELKADVSLHSNLIGKSIQVIFENELTKNFRKQVAHFLVDDGTILNVSDYEFLSKYDNSIYLMEICCRIVIENQENYYRQVRMV